MKKRSLILFIIIGLAVCLATHNSLIAQNIFQETGQTNVMAPKFGFTFGVNTFKVQSEITSSYFGNISGSSGSKYGLYGGLTADIPLTRRFSLQTELLYMQKGVSSGGSIMGDSDFIDDEDIEDGSVIFHYIDLPVLVRFHIDTERNVAPSVYAGPYAGYRFHISTSEGGEIDDETESLYRTISSGLLIGGSLGFDNFTIDLRYDIGIRNLNDLDSFLEFGDDDNDDEFDNIFEDLFGDLEVSNKFRGLTIGIKFLF